MTIYIGTYTDFAKIGVDGAFPLSETYYQTANIVIPSSFTGIGSVVTPFTGKYYGNGYRFSGTSITADGLFNAARGASGATAILANIIFEITGTITGTTASTGGILGVALGGVSVGYCCFSGSVTNTDANGRVGGIVGCCDGNASSYSNTVSRNSYYGTNVSIISQRCAGGIIGSIDTINYTMSYCYVYYNTIGINKSNGLLSDSNASSITIKATGFVGPNYSGGIVGCCTANAACQIWNNLSYLGATGRIANTGLSNSWAGGIVGLDDSHVQTSVMHCVVYGSNLYTQITNSGSGYTQAIGTFYTAPALTTCFYRSRIASGSQNYGIALTTAQMTVRSNYTNLSYIYWQMSVTLACAVLIPDINIFYHGNDTAYTGEVQDGTSIKIGSTLAIKANGFVSGKTFGAWCTNAAGTGTFYAASGSVLVTTANAASIGMLYAIWQTVQTVTYDGNGNDGGTVPSPASANSGTVYSISSDLPTKTGYNFGGWLSSHDGMTYRYGQSFYMPVADVTLTAIWLDTYNVTYDGNGSDGGTVPVDETGYSPDDPVTLLGPGTMTKTGYAFAGWMYDFVVYQPGNTIVMPDGNITVTAVWVIAEHTIDVEVSPIEAGTVTGAGGYNHGDTCTLVATASGSYIFSGWYIGSVLKSASTTYAFTVEEDATVVALFVTTFLILTPSETDKYVDVGVASTILITSSQSGTAYTLAEGPSWITVAYSTGIVTILAECPAGYYRVQVMGKTSTKYGSVTLNIFVNTPPLPTIQGRWRAAIYTTDGEYIQANEIGTSGLKLKEEPYVRLEKNAPSKAILTISNRPYNLRSVYYSGWSGGGIGPVVNGMQVVVDYVDDLTGQTIRRFNGTIRKIQTEGSYIVVTAYDSLMRLDEYAEPFQVYGTFVSDDKTYDREYVTYSGNDGYMYTMSAPVTAGTITKVDYLDWVDEKTLYDLASVEVYPSVSHLNDMRISGAGHTLVAAYDKISKIYIHATNSENYYGFYTEDAVYRAAMYEYDSASGKPSSLIWQSDEQVVTHLFDITFDCDVSLIVGNTYFIAYLVRTVSGGLPYRTCLTTQDVSYNYAYISNLYDPPKWVVGGVPAANPSGYHYPGIGVRYDSVRQSAVYADNALVNTSNIQQIFGPVADATDGGSAASDTKGVAMIATYVSTGQSIPVIVSDLISRAGLYPDMPLEDSDTRTFGFYNTANYDYLSAIHELIDSVAYDTVAYWLRGIQDDVTMPGRILIRKLVNSEGAPPILFTDDPWSITGNKLIESHTLQETWEEEVTMPTYLSTDQNNENKPIAIQTDDLLFSDSKITAFGHPYISIYTDNTLQDHSMLAIAAETVVRKIHTNPLEGSLTLIGRLPSLWYVNDTVNVCGRLIGINVPDYGAIDMPCVPQIIEYKEDRTIIDLDNVRWDNRSAIYSGIKQSADDQSYTVESLGNAAYVFVNASDIIPTTLDPTTITGMDILDEHGLSLTASTPTTAIKDTYDRASDTAGTGYIHVSALFPVSASGYAPAGTKIKYLKVVASATYIVMLTNGINAWPDQYVHVSLRYKYE